MWPLHACANRYTDCTDHAADSCAYSFSLGVAIGRANRDADVNTDRNTIDTVAYGSAQHTPDWRAIRRTNARANVVAN